MIEVENTDVNIVRNLIPTRNHMPASAYGLKAISDWFFWNFLRRKMEGGFRTENKHLPRNLVKRGASLPIK